jgi:Tfp pilus assembly protein PilP
MKLTTGILAVVIITGAAWAQNPGATDNTRSAGKSAQPVKANDTKATLVASAVPAQPGKPSPGAPAPAVKPATIPAAKQTAAPAKPASVPAVSKNNLLEKVNIVRNPGDVQIEINSREAVTPKVSKLSSPARVVVELPATVMANAQDKIAVGSGGVKGVRIGMDGKTPPTTSVVVDLEKPFSYDLTQGSGNKLVLTLHTQAAAPVVAKTPAAPAPVVAVAKTSAPVVKPQTASAKPVTVPAPAAVAKSNPAPAKTPASAPKPQTASAKPVVTIPAPAMVAKSNPAPAKTPAPAPKAQTASAKPVLAVPVPILMAKNNGAPATAKPQDAFTPKKPVASTPVAAVKVEAPKTEAKTEAKTAAKPAAPPTTKIAANEKLTVVSKTAEAPKAAEAQKTAEAPKPPKPEEKKWAMTGKRDPFFSPVVQQPAGPGCSTGKKCLDIGQINLRGVVKSENGFIAVVTNSLNKAYFLHENDPVFNGYVMKITGDSVVFQETVQDKLGKPLTREVVKRIFTPAV